ncbi:hypothetical protein cyc_01612 [Cyclospora cayetanensis]|uniref:Uncharacterized protein n=1 Tax=Cyclospora cayetanensis TaxID=88456 RepID=A0A1D3D978_9EIME|nr:hypothetical protein cyc_01612 [Cyclospora cayetanensis]
MDTDHCFEWNSGFQERDQYKAPEKPDAHGLCWRKTQIGLVAFKTLEDGSKTWMHFDSREKGTEVFFSETTRAFYADGDMTVPVPLVKPLQTLEHGIEEHREPNKTALTSQNICITSTATSRLESMPKNFSQYASHTGPEFNLSKRSNASPTIDTDLPLEEESSVELGRSRETVSDSADTDLPGTPRVLENSAYDGHLSFPNTEEQAGVPERLEKIAEEEKAYELATYDANSGCACILYILNRFLAAFECQLTVINTEMERTQSTVALAEQADHLATRVRFASGEVASETPMSMHGAPTEVPGSNASKQPQMQLEVHESPVRGPDQDAQPAASGAQSPIHVTFLFSPEQSSREPSGVYEASEPLVQPAAQAVQTEAPKDSGHQTVPQPVACPMPCWTLRCCEGPVEPEPEGPPPNLAEQDITRAPDSEPVQIGPPLERGAQGWNAVCRGSPTEPGYGVISPPIEAPSVPPDASAETKQLSPRAAPGEAAVVCGPTEHSKPKEQPQVVYIDHHPEPFVKLYFGDDGAEEIPEDWRDFGLASTAEVLFAIGSAVGVVVTGGAVVVGTALLTAGLTVGITAQELYKRITNNYNI